MMGWRRALGGVPTFFDRKFFLKYIKNYKIYKPEHRFITSNSPQLCNRAFVDELLFISVRST